MKVVVTFAVDWEFKAWRRLRAFRPSLSDRHVYQTRIAASDVDVVLTGVGFESAIETLHTALDVPPDFCIVSGLAGGLNPQHRPGNILAARSIRSEAGDGHFRSDEKLLTLAVRCGAKPVERFISVRRVARTSEQKSGLAALADAVDMESFAVMGNMQRSGVPSVAIRAISDAAEFSLPYDFDRALDSSGRVRMADLLGQIARSPAGVWPMARLGMTSFKAATLLAHYLDGYIRCLEEYQESLKLTMDQVASL